MEKNKTKPNPGEVGSRRAWSWSPGALEAGRLGGWEQRYHQETWPPAAGPWETRWWKRETEMGSGSIASDICHPHPWLPCSTLKSFLCLGKVENYFHEELSEGIPQTPTQWRFMWPEADCISKVVLSRQSVGHTRNASMIPGEQREKRDNTNVCSSFSSSSLLIKRKISLEHKGGTKSWAWGWGMETHGSYIGALVQPGAAGWDPVKTEKRKYQKEITLM